MPFITTNGPYGPITVQTFDHEAFAKWKQERNAWRRKLYAESPTLQSDAKARATESRKRRKAAAACDSRSTP